MYGIFDGTQDAGSHFVARLLEARVNAGDYNVHLREDFVVEIEGAVGKDVDFDSCKDADAALHLLVDFADAGDVFEGALLIEPIDHGQVFGVVGDGDVLQTALDSGFGHLRDGVVSVTCGRVHVHVAP